MRPSPSRRSRARSACSPRARRMPAGIEAPAVVLTALASLPLLWCRRAPLAVFVLTGLASTALGTIAEPAGPPLGPTIALFWLALSGDGSRARTGLTLAVVVAMLGAHAAAAGLADDRFPGAELLFGVLLWSGTWLAGDRARLRAERMAELEERAVRAEREAERERRLAAAEERMRIARDLHDSAGHAINVILVHAGAARLQADSATRRQRARSVPDDRGRRARDGRRDRPAGRSAARGRLVSGHRRWSRRPGLAALDGLVERHRAAGLDVTASDPRPQPAATAGRRPQRLPHPSGGAHERRPPRRRQRSRSSSPSGRTQLEFTVANPVGRRAGGARRRRTRRDRHARARRSAGRQPGGRTPRTGSFEVHARLPLAGRPA